MAELTTLTAAIYRKYRTRLDKTMENCGPGITSRFEVFHDALIPEVKVRNAVYSWTGRLMITGT